MKTTAHSPFPIEALTAFAVLCVSPWILTGLIGLFTRKTPIDTVQGLPPYEGPKP